MGKTSIEWTHRPGKVPRNWNIVRGCRRVSPGCERCYAENMAHRFSGKGKNGKPQWGHGLTDQRGRWNGTVQLQHELLAAPLSWRKPACVFVCSTSDLFQDGVPFEFLAAAFGVMAATPQHTYLLLTKRPQRALEFFRRVESNSILDGCIRQVMAEEGERIAGIVWDGRGSERWRYMGPAGDVSNRRRFPGWPLPNVEIGVTSEDQQRADERIPVLLQIPAARRFVSAEPLLSPIDFTDFLSVYDRHGEPSGPRCRPNGRSVLDQVIVGGESGSGARSMDLDWARSIRDQCYEANVAFFFKQTGTAHQLAKGLKGKGVKLKQIPEDLKVREFPSEVC